MLWNHTQTLVVFPWVVNMWNNGNTGKPVTLKPLVNIYPCETRNHIFNTNFIDLLWYSGENCDQHGNYISTDLPLPLCESDCEPDDWYPYQGQIEFEVANFLYCQNQMSASDIDTLLNLWGASTATQGGAPPFQNHQHLHDTIDSTPLGNTPWESFSLRFNGYWPEGQVSSWMDTDYNFWLCNPCQLVHNIISNPDFKDGFDYTPYQEHNINGSHHYHNLMSANWAWWQAVHSIKTSLSACTSYA